MRLPTIFTGADGSYRVLDPGDPVTEVKHHIGLDLGQVNDSTALVVVERRKTGDAPATYQARAIERWLGRSYPDIVREVGELVRRPELRNPLLIIDATGVGRPVVDLFGLSSVGCAVVPVTITAGDQAYRAETGGGWYVPKRDLVEASQVLMQSRRLEIAAKLREAGTLKRELQDFRYKLSDAGHDTYNARSGAHDDVLLALCLAVWYGEMGGTTQVW